MKIIITGSSSGIGLETAKKFLKEGFIVYGIDVKPSNIENENYHHYIADVSKKEQLPTLDNVDIIFANAGKQNSKDDIDNNLKGTINTIEKYDLLSENGIIICEYENEIFNTNLEVYKFKKYGSKNIMILKSVK